MYTFKTSINYNNENGTKYDQIYDGGCISIDIYQFRNNLSYVVYQHKLYFEFNGEPNQSLTYDKFIDNLKSNKNCSHSELNINYTDGIIKFRGLVSFSFSLNEKIQFINQLILIQSKMKYMSLSSY